MRYPKEHKARTRDRLIDAGGGHAKKHGFAATGMDAMAAAADVTTGSLYRHFDGKSELFACVVQAELQRTAERFAAADPDDRAAALRALHAYLSKNHVDHPEQGCLLPSLTAEVARADDRVRTAFQSGLQELHATLERLTGSGGRAWALIAQSVGAVMIARAMLDGRLREEVLSAARKEGQALLR
jgi:TetR/AcrR family transcriptional regulator, transcriptional repressor for nem operon